jgi:hypothetical protein
MGLEISLIVGDDDGVRVLPVEFCVELLPWGPFILWAEVHLTPSPSHQGRRPGRSQGRRRPGLGLKAHGPNPNPSRLGLKAHGALAQ